MRLFPFILSFFLCTGISELLSAQFSNIRFKHLTTVNDLPDIYVTCIFQDSRGFLWFGTREGLARFDGVQMIKYYHAASDSATLSNNTILSIEEDDSGNIWIGTQKGINILQKGTGTFKRFATELPAIGKHLSCNAVEDIARDPDGSMWIGTSGGLFHYEKETGVFKLVLQRHSGNNMKDPANIYKHCIAFDSKNNLFVFMGNAIYRSVNKGQSFDSLPGFRPAIPPAGHLDPSFMTIIDDKLCYAYQQIPELIVTDISSNQSRKIQLYQFNPKSIPPVQVWHAARVNEKEIWVAALGDDNNRDFGGVFVLDNDFNVKYQILSDRNDPNSITMPWVLQVYKDRQGTIWLATLESADYYHPSFSTFRVYDQFNKNTRSAYACPALCSDRLNQIWCGSWDNGIARLDPRSGEVKKYSVPYALSENNSYNIIYYLAADRKNQLWVLTAGGLIQFNTKTETYTKSNEGKTLKVFSKAITKIISDPSSSIWFSTTDTVGKYNDDMQIFTAVYPDQQNDGKKKTVFNFWTDDNDSYLWILRGNPIELIRLNKYTGKEIIYRFPALQQHIWWIRQAGDSVIYLATDRNGFYAYYPSTGKSEEYNISTGLPSNQVKSMAAGADGSIWLGTMKGIVRFDPLSRSFRNYTIQDGLETESVIHSNAQSTDGTIFFPTIQNVVAINPGAILQEKPAVSPGFIHLKIGEKEKYMANWSTPVSLAAYENSFSIDFSSMNMVTPGSDEFQYILEGYDKTWISAGNRRFANYTNLPGGHYLFKLRCRNGTKQWSAPTVLNFEVATIFYKTWWFISLVALLIGTVGFLFYRMKLTRLMALNNMRQRFSRDLHDDIGSTLSSINILTRTGGGQNGEDVIFTLKKIQERSQKMLDAMDDIIWSAKPENDPMESLVIRMREYAGEVLEAAGIDYSIEIPDAMKDIKLNMEQKKNLYLVFKEAINNLAKYSKSKEAIIHFQMNRSLLQMEVNDTGVGFDPSHVPKGNGLENMKARTAEMNGNLVIDTSVGKGTTVKVELPL